MPLVIYAFSLCAFALGFTEFVTIGLISTVAADFHIDVARMGAAVTVYAGGVVLGAPILTALTASWSRKSVILCTMLAFTAGNVAVGFSQNLPMLLAARLIAGLAHGVFFAVAANVASRLVRPERAGSALSLVFGGVTVAMALAVPIGTWLGSVVPWRTLFFATALCGIAGSTGIAVLMPSDDRNGKDHHSATLDDLRALVDHRLLAGASIPMLSFAGSFMLYTYVSPLLLKVTHLHPDGISIALLSYGIGSALGNIIGGRLNDAFGWDRASIALLAGIATTLALVAIAARHPAAMVVLIGALGFMTFGALTPLQARMLMLAERHRPRAAAVASGMNIAAFNAGVVVGSGTGALVISTLALSMLAPIGAALVIASVIILLWQTTLPSMRSPGTARTGLIA